MKCPVVDCQEQVEQADQVGHVLAHQVDSFRRMNELLQHIAKSNQDQCRALDSIVKSVDVKLRLPLSGN